MTATTSVRIRTVDWRRVATPAMWGLMLAFFLMVPGSAFGQEYVLVPERQTHTDVKQGSSSGSVVLVLVPKGTALPLIKRQGEWIQVKLSPELRKTGIPMRRYRTRMPAGFTSQRWKCVKAHRPRHPNSHLRLRARNTCAFPHGRRTPILSRERGPVRSFSFSFRVGRSCPCSNGKASGFRSSCPPNSARSGSPCAGTRTKKRGLYTSPRWK